MGMIFFSPGCRVKRTAIAPASFSLSLTHDVSLLASRPSLAKGAQTAFPSPDAQKGGLVGHFNAGRFQG